MESKRERTRQREKWQKGGTETCQAWESKQRWLLVAALALQGGKCAIKTKLAKSQTFISSNGKSLPDLARQKLRF